VNILLELKHVYYRFAKRGEWLFKDINLCVAPGTRTAILGTSGAGTTALFELVIGLRKASQGEVKRHGKIGLVTQNFSWYQDLTVAENIEFCRVINDGNPRQVEQLLSLTTLKNWENTRAQQLPAGFRRMLQVVCALVREPDLLVLDDPTAGLDQVLQKKLNILLEQVNAAGTAILIFTSDQRMIADCQQVFYLNQQCLLNDTKAEESEDKKEAWL